MYACGVTIRCTARSGSARNLNREQQVKGHEEGEEMTRQYLQRAAFRSVVTHRLAHDIQNNWYVVTK
jgi:hypothetical protein